MRVDRPREGDDQPDDPLRHARGKPDHPVLEDASVDRAEVWREYRKAVDAEYSAYAVDKGCDRVREIERNTVSPAMERIEAEDPTRHLVGFENRLKDKDRLTEKVAFDMQKKGISADDAFANVKDAIRYTFQYTDDRYADGVQADVNRLKHEGFELVDLRNTWGNDEYKGINSRWEIPGTRQRFEVQFHTQASFEAKQETHPAYEKLRTPETPRAEREELQQYQREVTARIPMPRGATDIPNYP